MSAEPVNSRSTPKPPLAGHPVLVLDCQATGSDPRRDRLLEVGWAATTAKNGGAWEAEAHILRLAPEIPLPRAVARFTGLKAADLRQGLTPRRVWKRLLATGDRLTSPAHPARPYLVIHFARYETPFLHRMHRISNGPDPFPFEIICTHKIARRLYPQLPRLGLRALAGYLGHPMSEHRRCRPHVNATAHIWRCLCKELEKVGVDKFYDLYHWMEGPTPPRPTSRVYPMAREIRNNLPLSPGVYRFVHNGDLTLYVGKTKSLRQRVSSYFQPRRKHPGHILEMLTQARGIEIIPTASALEAALTEWDEIQQRSPMYNIALRKTGRNLNPWSTDLRPMAPDDTRTRRLGFFAQTDILKGLRLIISHARHPATRGRVADRAGIAQMVGVSPEMAPSPSLLDEGLSWLCRTFPQLKHTGGLVNYLAVGANWEWRQRKHAEIEEKSPKSAPSSINQAPKDDPSSPLSEPWTPETVGRALARRLAHGARLIRRAHWFTLISESSMAWQPANGDEKERRLLMIRRGQIHQVQSLKNLDRLPEPKAWNRPRQKRLSLLTSDDITRLRVLTTEIKRLVVDQRPMRLCLGPRRCYDRAALTRITEWL